jgi:hypothetical protein
MRLSLKQSLQQRARLKPRQQKRPEILHENSSENLPLQKYFVRLHLTQPNKQL